MASDPKRYCATHGGDLRSHIKPEGYCMFLAEDFDPPCVPAFLVGEKQWTAMQDVVKAALAWANLPTNASYRHIAATDYELRDAVTRRLAAVQPDTEEANHHQCRRTGEGNTSSAVMDDGHDTEEAISG